MLTRIKSVFFLFSFLYTFERTPSIKLHMTGLSSALITDEGLYLKFLFEDHCFFIPHDIYCFLSDFTSNTCLLQTARNKSIK